MTSIRKILACAAIACVPAIGHAVPALQLDIEGGTYVGGDEETIVTSDPVFDLIAVATAGGSDDNGGQLSGDEIATDTFYISIALIGAGLDETSDSSLFGDILVDGVLTGGWAWDHAPVHTDENPEHLGSHGVFPAWMIQLSFQFSDGVDCATYNTQDDAGAGITPGTGSTCMSFGIDMTGLADGLNLHFDLYTDKDKRDGLARGAFAPFSHDAATTTVVPEPDTLALLGLGLLALGMTRRRRQLR